MAHLGLLAFKRWDILHTYILPREDTEFKLFFQAILLKHLFYKSTTCVLSEMC